MKLVLFDVKSKMKHFLFMDFLKFQLSFLLFLYFFGVFFLLLIFKKIEVNNQ